MALYVIKRRKDKKRGREKNLFFGHIITAFSFPSFKNVQLDKNAIVVASFLYVCVTILVATIKEA